MQFLKLFLKCIFLCLCVRITQPAVLFPSNSAYGLFAAIAVPLDLPHRNVFISYNFEANYNLPNEWGLPNIAEDLPEGDLFEDARFNDGRDCYNCTSSSLLTEDTLENNDDLTETEEDDEVATTVEPLQNKTGENITRKRRRRRVEINSLLTRTHFYHILMDKFLRSGFEGEPCLLRLICEINASELGEVNGVLGNLIHIMFSPTTSKTENLPWTYYQAELDGLDDQCHHYEKKCPKNILDFMSTPIPKFIDQIQENLSRKGQRL